MAELPFEAAPTVIEHAPPPPVAAEAAPVVATRPIVPAVPPLPLTLPADSGLVLVETSHSTPSVAIDEVETPRPRRVRPPKVEIASEPLEFIETRKEPPASA